MTDSPNHLALPPLPEPEVGIWGSPDSDERDKIVRRLYSHWQMEEYARAAVLADRERRLLGVATVRDDMGMDIKLNRSYTLLPGEKFDLAAAIRDS